MNIRTAFFAFLILMITDIAAAQETKVVGYLPYYRFGNLDQIGLEHLTHLCIAFANPDAQGNISMDGVDIWPVVQRAHEADVKVLASLAGGALKPEWAEAWARLTQARYRSGFIHRIIQYTLANELDGIDIDLEWKYVDAQYSGFVLELRDSLHAHGKLMTAALPGIHRYKHITDKAMLAFDFINLMAYDLTGQFDPQRPGPHSPYSLAVAALDYWKGLGMPANKLVLGLPLYGWDFSTPGTVHSVNYGDIVASNPAYAHTDQVGRLYYNGILTVVAKTELAKREGGGVMLWELGKDALNEFSLLKTAYHTIHGEPVEPATPAFSPLPDSIGVIAESDFSPDVILPGAPADPDMFRLEVEIFPNPFQDTLQITNKEEWPLQLVLSDKKGRPLFETFLRPNSTINWETASFPSGQYTVSAMKGSKQMSKTLRKM
ncbi:MAG: hypothetical protein KDD02_04045 [Phaeodactylibacter sp.]|nr:hypothetical protein [Phaeodactylibacter sp.]MCB9300446.1 hypothetical protein [Lewinellaceae bacterium]HQU57612.1 glycosyl hydrolase family 18 protein [Saprospiraceae bacterium]